MERRSLARLMGALTVAMAPAAARAQFVAVPPNSPPTVQIPPGGGPLFAVYAGPADHPPVATEYTFTAAAGSFVGSLTAGNPADAAEASAFQARLGSLKVGQSDQMRTVGINVDPDGKPGTIRVTRVR